MTESLFYNLRSGKPNKPLYFVRKSAGLLVPDAFYRARLQKRLKQAAQRPDYDYMKSRADYYIRLTEPWAMPAGDRTERERNWLLYTGRIGDYRRSLFHTAYYFDQHDVTRWFPKHLRWNYLPGDVYFTPSVPTVVKSRLLTADNRNSVVLKLDKLRHFFFVNDPCRFADKRDATVFRGKIRQSRLRTSFLERCFGNPLFDCGVVGRDDSCPEAWRTPKKTIREHLDYKFVMAIEGNDVASNLKWVMSSNSIAVMTRPTCETWFMEGTLKPDVHYIEVREDFADIEEKLRHYAAHPDEAQQIIDAAHAYVDQFRDNEREELIQLMVMQRYFALSGQL